MSRIAAGRLTKRADALALALVLALAELLDDLGAERRQVVRIARGHEALVDHDLLVDPGAARVADVGLQRRPRRDRAAARATSASTSVHGPWQITPTGLACSKKPRTNATASLVHAQEVGVGDAARAARARRSRTRSRRATVRSTGNVSPLSRWLNAWTSPSSSEISSGLPPSPSTAFHGSVSSTCSTPSGATRKAMRLPCSLSAMVVLSVRPLGPTGYPGSRAFHSRGRRG